MTIGTFIGTPCKVSVVAKAVGSAKFLSTSGGKFQSLHPSRLLVGIELGPARHC